PPGEVAILFLSRGDGSLPACPIPAAVQDVAVYGTGRGKAFHITTDKPVGAYQILPYGGGSVAATSATLLLPVNVWDTQYMAVNAYQKSAAVADALPSLDILAQVDGTEVTVTPNVAITGGNGVAGTSANQPVTYSLNAGEYVQISQAQELTGSTVESNHPVAFWGAASCLNVPINQTACDSAHQQIPPINALGNSYVGVRYRGRNGDQNESPPWRLVGAVDGTVLTWQPSAPAGAPTALSAGQVVEFTATGPFVVTSQDLDHPFYAAAYMTGGAGFGGEGDPEWVNIIPPDQYLNDYVLFTDPTYSETNLVVVRKPDQNGQFADVTLDCAGTLTGWQPVGDYQYTRVDLVTGNFQNVGNCSNGRHEMESALPFGVTVWGWGSSASSVFTQYVSYAYPAGAAVKKINDIGN
ncbi:MAG: IgGFc-binding protein, partial [Myxococcota bacterium]